MQTSWRQHEEWLRRSVPVRRSNWMSVPQWLLKEQITLGGQGTCHPQFSPSSCLLFAIEGHRMYCRSRCFRCYCITSTLALTVSTDVHHNFYFLREMHSICIFFLLSTLKIRKKKSSWIWYILAVSMPFKSNVRDQQIRGQRRVILLHCS